MYDVFIALTNVFITNLMKLRGILQKKLREKIDEIHRSLETV